ncbi:MAG: hypothetical protein IPK60_04820 [Sandaracinaceae bacterium]|nr:hypothetical protein [Sandaracinaceae bacterium]
MTKNQITRAAGLLSASTLALALAGCGGAPTHTETSSSEVVEHPEGGAEVRTSTTETNETNADGVQTTDRQVTTETTPAPQQ